MLCSTAALPSNPWISPGPRSRSSSGPGLARWRRRRSTATAGPTTRGSTATRKEFSRELAAHGWIGMTWPVEFGGGGRPPIERLIVAEEMISAGAPIAAIVVRRSADGPDAHRPTARPSRSGEFLPGILSRRDDVVHRHERARGRLRPRRRSRPRAVRDGDDFVINGQKIWTSFGEVADYCYLICRTVDRGPPARRHQRDRRPDGHARHRGPADQGHDDQPPLLRGLLHRRAGARRPTSSAPRARRFKQTMRQLEHERGGIDRLVSNRALYVTALERADRSDPHRAPGDRRGSRPATASAACS